MFHCKSSFVALWSVVMVGELGAGCNSDGQASSGSKSKTTQIVEPTRSKRDVTSPPSVVVKLILLTDKRCRSRRCRTGRTVAKLKRAAPSVQVERLDWSSPRAKKIFAREGLKYLPAYLFSANAIRAPGLQRLARYLKPTPTGALRQLKTRSDFDPHAEVCDNEKDDTGNGLTDCKDPSCKAAAVCRPEIPKRLEVFVMSMCPFGTRALDSMSELLKAFGKRLDFKIHFIASARPSGFRSLHGQPEVDENIRELCAIQHYGPGAKYMDYIWCRNRKIKDKNWQACTGKKTGIDAKVIQTCATGEEGKRLLGTDIKLAQKLRIGSSPTWLANNRFVFHGIAPESIKRAFCRHNPGLAGCEKKLSTKAPVPDGVCN